MLIPYTEAACVQRLQEIVSEISVCFYKKLSEEVHSSSKKSKRFFSLLSENDLINATGNISEKELENYCRLAALIGILQQTVEQNPDKKNLSFLHKAFKDLPENFRSFLKLFSDSFSKEIKDDVFRDIQQILLFPSDIIGNVYNKFSYNAYQQRHGQHFTQTAEADILNAFCIKKDTVSVFDGSCGSGVFLLRAFYFFEYLNKDSGKFKRRLTGIDVSPFATCLTTINFSFRGKNTEKDFAEIITEDFKKIDQGQNKNTLDLPAGVFVGNPPYIRHELMNDKKQWGELIRKKYGISYISGQSDLYIYFLVHAVSLLKEGGRLGWVISASWLDVQFGSGLQRFLLEHCKIISIMDYQAKRSFDTASVNTVLLVIEKCSKQRNRENNLVKFVRIFSEYEELMGKVEDKSRIKRAIGFAEKIEKISERFSDKKLQVEVAAQKSLYEDSMQHGKFKNGHWGAKYLRSPHIYNEIIARAGKKRIPLSEIADVKYGVKTGANDFFYLTDETGKATAFADEEYKRIFGAPKKKHFKIWNTCGWYRSSLNGKHFIIEKEFILPVFKTQKEADRLDVKISNLKFCVLNCSLQKDILKEKNKKVLDYITVAENEFHIHKRPSVSSRGLWYDLSPAFIKGDFIFPSKIGERYRLIDNRKAQVVCDKVNYVIRIKEEWEEYADELFLILNSITFRYFIDLFSRQLTGSQTLSDVDVQVLKDTLIPHPADFRKKCSRVKDMVRSLKSREQLSIAKEILQKDKFEIDSVIGKMIGLNKKEIEQLYHEASMYVEKRQLKSDSLRV